MVLSQPRTFPRPADLSVSFAHRPIDDPAPFQGTLVLGIADTPRFIHASQGQIGIPIGIRRAIVVISAILPAGGK